MKISVPAADRFVVKPDPAAVAVLLYGPNRGLVQERAERLARTVVDSLDDPFRVADLPAVALAADPARLADEAAAQSLTGGRRVVRVRGAGNEIAPIVETMLGHVTGDALVIVEAGELSPKARLRSLFETAANAAAIACYQDDTLALETVVKESLASHGLSVGPGALAYMTSRLGADRKVARSQLDKLALYMGERTEVTEDDAVACIGDGAELGLDDLADAVAGGDHASAARALSRLALDGTNPIAIVRSLQRHFQKLHLAGAMVAGGAAADTAVASLRPPIFFKRRAAFGRQLRAWPMSMIVGALDLLLDAELDCKTTGLPAAAVCAQTVTRLTQAAAQTTRRAA